jgi:hypothetical protein
MAQLGVAMLKRSARDEQGQAGRDNCAQHRGRRER